MTFSINGDEFEVAFQRALQFFPDIFPKKEQIDCVKTLVVDRRDVLGVLPTGFGKSFMYQILPKIYFNAWKAKHGEEKSFKIIVVNPLELIRDQQVKKLCTLGIKAVALETFDKISLESAEIIFGSAEQWMSEELKNELKSGVLKDVSVLVVDEAHTVETWGKGKKRKAAFREAFGHVKDLRSFLGHKPLLAITATADADMRKRLCSCLALKTPKEVVISPNNSNIRYSVLAADKELNCFNWLVELVRAEKENTPFSIIFCHTVSDIVKIFSVLLMKLGKDAYVNANLPHYKRCIIGIYYSASPDPMKTQICDSFGGKEGYERIVIASTSLSMGVDFQNVRYVIHFGPGRSLTEHLQQAGRAGRDKLSAYNLIYYQGKHLSGCDLSVRDVIKKKDCIRKLLLSSFVEGSIPPVLPLHSCCSRCHQICKCDHENCAIPLFNFDKLDNTHTAMSKRIVSPDDRDCLSDALMEVKDTLGLQTNVTLFDSTGVITHGLSATVIESLVANCESIFSVMDLMDAGLVSSLKVATIVLEVFNEIFEDIDNCDDLQELAEMSSLMFNMGL